VASEPLSAFFEQYHRNKGVDILTSANVSRLIGDDQYAVEAIIVNGRMIACEVVVVGVGGHANDELARKAGLACENGIVVDLCARTSDPNIFAVGDVTWRPMPIYGNRMFRLESVPNALEQAKQVACAIVGRPAPASEVPWFWSDQYDLKLQIAGVPFDSDDLIVRGDFRAGKFAVFHLKSGKILAVEAVNAIPEFMIGKQLIAAGKSPSREQLKDISIPMRRFAM
jgi:3-phenylpropionate/trans-cinnamate dioxygenase ferredoxin reductase subunit